jgi:hypothetical protein
MRISEIVLEIKKGAKDSNGYTKCWTGYHAAGTKKGKNGGRVRNCVPNESVSEGSAHGYNVMKWYEKHAGDQIKLTRWLKKEAGLPKDADVYFDDADLVYGDQTIVPNALVNPKLKFNDLLTAVVNASGSGAVKQNMGGYYRESATAGATSVGSIGTGNGHQLQRKAFNKSYTGSMTSGTGKKSPKQPVMKRQKPGTNALDGNSLVV